MQVLQPYCREFVGEYKCYHLSKRTDRWCELFSSKCSVHIVTRIVGEGGEVLLLCFVHYFVTCVFVKCLICVIYFLARHFSGVSWAT